MTMHELVSSVHNITGVDRQIILSRARSAWANVVDFKPTQVRLLVKALLDESRGKRVKVGSQIIQSAGL
jgi:hypothetical protein